MAASWILARPLVTRPEADHGGRIWALFITGLYVAASLVYGFLSDAPWDDDCIVRYFNSREAWRDPSQFFSVWNRPLFMVLFAPAALLGRAAMMVQMIAISAASGWLLYRTLDRLGSRSPHWVLPFFFFQTFYFSISRNFLTEPLAVAVICVGMHALVRERYMLFALMGGLLPLARLELVVVLPVWGIVLLQAKQLRQVLWMGLPVVALMLAGYLVKDTDNLLWLVEDTMGKEGKNRYGYRDVWHYFHRFAYVVGPVAFFFLVIGLLERIVQRRIDVFVLTQGVGILLLYVVFSSKLDMGNSAGFLRNLIPLTPFVAWLALDGLFAWQGLVAKEGAKGAAVNNAAAPLSREERKRKQKKAVAARPERALSTTWRSLRPHVFGLVAVAVLFVYFSRKLEGHHKISTVTDHAPVIIGGILALTGLTGWIAWRRRSVPRPLLIGMAVFVGMGTMGFTMLTERPDAHLNPERKAISTLSTLYKDSYLREWPLYANHAWFFWPNDLGYPDHAKYRVLNKAALDTADAHALVLWENHYSHRLQGNLQLADMYKRTDVVELAHVVSTDHRATACFFQKVDPARPDAGALRERFMTTYPDNIYAYYARNLEHARHRRFTEALADAEKMIVLDSNYVEGVLARAQACFDLARYDEAERSFARVLRKDTALYTMHYSIALCQMRAGRPNEAIRSINRYLRRDRKNKEVYELLGATYYNKQRYDSAAMAFTNYIKIDGRPVTGWLNRASCYMQQGKAEAALRDLDEALKRDPDHQAALLNKAVLLVRTGKKAAGCQLLQQLASSGNAAAVQQLALCAP